MSHTPTHALTIIAACAFALAACGNLENTDDAVGIMPSYKSETQTPLVGGEPTGAAHRQVGAIVAVTATGTTMALCTGTLIAPNVVLTAAHCVAFHSVADHDTRDPDALTFYFTQHEYAMPLGLGSPVAVARTVIHPQYDHYHFLLGPLVDRSPMDKGEIALLDEIDALCPGRASPFKRQAFMRCTMQQDEALLRRLGYWDAHSQMNDIALMFLRQPISDTQPAHLPRAPITADGNNWLLVGYGIHTWNSFFTSGVGQRYQGNATLEDIGHYELQMSHMPTQICSGDSGGPVLRSTPRGEEVVGVASRGAQNHLGHCDGWALHTRVDAYVPWIDQVIRELPQ